MLADAKCDGRPAEYRWRSLRKFHIPFLMLCYKVWLTATARVPCSNTANIGERKTWTLSEFCKIPLGSKSPKNVYIKERKGRVPGIL